MYTRNERIIPVYLEDEMKDSYIDYAMSVIVGRALPDVRDGLKPVHRRILYAMRELDLGPNKPYKKSARIVGDTLGRYHPHGDMAVYDALVRMVQNFSLRYPLIDGQGNFGSIDGDAQAAMRYTEARLAPITEEMLRDIEKDTVDFMPNFDESLQEPVVLPARLPNLLLNGSSGIAVGMATNIPPHNLKEIVDAIVVLIENPQVPIKNLMANVKGPDFPTGGIVCGKEGIRGAYQTGKGLIKLRAKVNTEKSKSGKVAIIISEIPYQVNKTSLLESMAELVQNRSIEGISNIRDESDREGMRIVIELKRDANAQIVLNQLYKHTQLETTFGIIMLALVDNRPRVLNLKQMLAYYIEHRKTVIRRRTNFELKRAERRAHILEGFKIALANINKIIKLIKSAKTPLVAKQGLIKNFSLSSEQAQAILEMQLQRLTALEQDRIEKEYLELIKKIELYRSILKNPKRVLAIIKEESLELKRKFGDERRTQIVAQAEELELEDLIAEEDMVITISHSGYIKRLPVSSYRKQHRGGRGVTAAEVREEDFIEQLFIASTHEYILFFTNKGKVYWLKVYEIPQAGRLAKGRAIINLLSLAPGESISASVPVKEFVEGRYLFMATQRGIVKKTALSAFKNPRKAGLIAINLDKSDELIAAELTDGSQEILLATQLGKAIRFSENKVRDMGRSARGVKGINLGKKDELVGMEIVQPKATLLTVTEKGFGKRTPFAQYREQNRAGGGIINIKVTNRNGKVVGLTAVTDGDELMLITESGMVVRCPVEQIRITGRSAQGVRLISLKGKDRVTSIAKVVAKE
jgi:DNA gyrase subunit A